MKYKEDMERNVGVHGGCMPSEINWVGWSATGKRVSGSSMVGKINRIFGVWKCKKSPNLMTSYTLKES